jgi:formylglycine-generating enzyme required for sulfatase activity
VIAGLLGLSSDDVFRRAERERRSSARRKRRVQALVGVLALLLIAAGVGWWKQDYLKEQYYWHIAMGPSVLTVPQEQALRSGDEFTECARDCPIMVLVPAGKVNLESRKDHGANSEGDEEPTPEEVAAESERDDKSSHEVTIAKSFAVGKFEVTFAEWDACVAAGGCPEAFDNGWGRGSRPVINVSWFDAHQYVAWLNSLSGKAYRLLSEAEWEYAAGAGSNLLDSYDLAKLDEYEWYKDNSEGKTQQAGKKKPNKFGLHDMLGNVSEFVEDTWHESYDGAPSDGSAWVGGAKQEEEGDDSLRVVRGNTWRSQIETLFIQSVATAAPQSRGDSFGFRVARTLDR